MTNVLAGFRNEYKYLSLGPIAIDVAESSPQPYSTDEGPWSQSGPLAGTLLKGALNPDP